MGSMRAIAVLGIYAATQSTEAAFVDLVNCGFTNSDISILLPDNEHTRVFAVETRTKASAAAASYVGSYQCSCKAVDAAGARKRSIYICCPHQKNTKSNVRNCCWC